MRHTAAALLLVLFGCAHSVQQGDTRESLVDSGALRFVLYEYERNGIGHVWIPTWHDGVLRLSTSHAAGSDDVSVLRFKDNVLVGQEDLGKDRSRWIERLRRDKADFGEHNILVMQGRIMEGMPVHAVLLSWGPPNGRPMSNPRWFRPTGRIDAGRDTLWYCWAVDRRGYPTRWDSLLVRDGKVVSVERGASQAGRCP